MKNKNDVQSATANASIDPAAYLPIVISLLGRIALPEQALRDIVGGKGKAASKWIAAYNKCDGLRKQSDIARECNLDKADLSKALKKWESAGAVFRIGDDGKPIKLYALQQESAEGSGDARSGMAPPTTVSNAAATPTE